MLDLLPPEIWSDKAATFLDPVCKSGVFLREIAKRLMIGLEMEIPDTQERVNHICKNQLFGLAITELTALLSRRSVYCSKTANGKYSICTVFDTNQGNILFEDTGHTWLGGKCSFCGASKSVYDRGEGFEGHAYKFIHMENIKEVFNMQFDVIVGNPPYQLSDGGFNNSAVPIYHLFVEQAKKFNPRYLTMIIPSRWFSGGRGLDGFRGKMLADKNICEIHDFPDATDLFPGVQIKGGICYFLRNGKQAELCKVSSYSKGGLVSSVERPLLEPDTDTFIRYNEAIGILRKIRGKKEPSFKDLVTSQKPFGLRTFVNGKKRPFDNCLKLYQRGGVGYVSPGEIINHDLAMRHKVLVPRAGSGSDSFPHTILGKPIYSEPGSCCTETYIGVGPFDSEQTAQNVISYLHTRFLRFLVLLIKNSQDAPRGVYSFVPMQDFSEAWTDEKLYRKYGITPDEIAFIDSMIRPMD